MICTKVSKVCCELEDDEYSAIQNAIFACDEIVSALSGCDDENATEIISCAEVAAERLDIILDTLRNNNYFTTSE